MIGRNKMRMLVWGFLVAALAAGCSKPAENNGGKKKERGPVPVRTARVERRDISETLLFTGELASPLAVEVKPKIQGRLEKLELAGGAPTTEGAEVKAGDVIAVAPKFKDLLPIKEALISSEHMAVPGWLEVDIEKLQGTVLQLPTRDQIDLDIDAQLIVELYSK